MPDPRPTSDDPLIISGQVPRALTQAPSTLDFGRTPYCPSAPCAQCRGGPCSCCCLGPGCEISGGDCFCTPFPPDPAQGGTGGWAGGCCPSDKPVLVLTASAAQCVLNNSETSLTFDTIEYNRGFSESGTVSSVSIPKTGVYHMMGYTAGTGCGFNTEGDRAILLLRKGCACCYLHFATLNGIQCACWTLDTSGYSFLNVGCTIALRARQVTGGTIALGSACLSAANKLALEFVRSC